MTKEEVAQVIAYCDENKISYKQRLSELVRISAMTTQAFRR